MILKLDNTERDLNATKQQLFATSQNLRIVEKKHAILDVNTDELEAKLQTKIAQVEIVGQGLSPNLRSM